jgi:hypothetical protein
MPPRKRDCTPVGVIVAVSAALMILVLTSLLVR